jgi:transcriptional regulator with XRE-family HTH domain
MSNPSYMAKKAWKTELGKQIKAARDRRQMTQEKLARRLKTKRGRIYLYEKGKGNPGLKIVAEIATLLKADFEVLGCRIVPAESLEPKQPKPEDQLELPFDRDHSFLANVTIRPTRKSITITAHSDYGIRSA